MIRRLWLPVLLILAACASPPGTKPTTLSGGVGLTAEYFSNPDFSGRSVVQVDSALEFDWGSVPPAIGLFPGNFSAHWAGYIEAKSAGSYTFYVTASGKTQLRIDQKLVVDGSSSASVELSAGSHEIEISYVKESEDASLRIEWSSATIAREVLSRGALFPLVENTRVAAAAVPQGQNLIRNGDFEAGTGSWVRKSGTVSLVQPGRSGNGYAQKLNVGGWTQQELPYTYIATGSSYTLEAWGNAAVTGNCEVGLMGGNLLATTFRKALNFNGAWERKSLSYTVPSGTIWLLVYTTSSTSDCRFDDISLMTGTQPVPNPTPSTNLLDNAGFESGISKWQIFGGSTKAITPGRSGTQALQVAGWNWVQQDVKAVDVQAGKTYVLSGWAKSPQGGSCTIGLLGGNGSKILFARTLAIRTTGWSSSVLSQTFPATTQWAIVYMFTGLQACQFDDLQLQLDQATTPPPPVVKNVVQILYSDGAGVTVTRRTPQMVSRMAFSAKDASKAYAVMLANLLGRYSDIKVVTEPISSYTGQKADTLRSIYIGSIFDETLPDAFLNDAANGAPITWIGYNLWKLNATQTQQLGLSYVQLVSALDSTTYTTTYNKIDYRGYTFSKVLAPMDMVEVSLQATDATVLAWAQNSTGSRIPYALQKGQFYYIADNPFIFIGERDRYLILADLLGPMTNHSETCQPKAVLRLEDYNPNSDPVTMTSMLDILERRKVPFAVAVIPQYVDNNIPLTLNFSDRPLVLDQLKRIETIGGRIFQHGTTHQYDNLKLPQGISGVDWEFWDIVNSQAIPGQTADSAAARIQTGKQLLQTAGVNPVGWITPHYNMEPAFYTKVNPLYPRYFERRLYRANTEFVSQFFPYPVKDSTGALIIPENLRNVDTVNRPADILETAKANRALRCPWGGFFFHPFLLNPANAGSVTPQEFEDLLTNIQNLGYTFVDPNTVTP